ncbi:unnamed protein product, partial [Adineta ricciae]
MEYMLIVRFGYIYVSDYYNHRVLKLLPNSNSSTSATTVAGTGSVDYVLNQLYLPSGIHDLTGSNGTDSPSNRLYIPLEMFVLTRFVQFMSAILQITELCSVSGTNGTKPWLLNNLYEICSDTNGNVYFAKQSDYRVHRCTIDNSNDWIINNHNGSYNIRGEVPGTIHTILFAANQISEPYRGYNDVNLRYLVYDLWTFRKNFSLTNDILSLTKFTIHFDQIDTIANITLNQCFLGQTNNMFVGYSFDITRNCLKSTNELRLDFESPVIYALDQSQSYNDSVPPFCPPDIQHGECHVQFIRKEPCSFSW